MSVSGGRITPRTFECQSRGGEGTESRSEFQKPSLFPPGFLKVSLWGAGALREQFGGEFQKPCLLPPGFLNVSLGGAGVLREQFGGEFQEPCLLPPGFLNVSLGGAGALWGQNSRNPVYYPPDS